MFVFAAWIFDTCSLHQEVATPEPKEKVKEVVYKGKSHFGAVCESELGLL